MTKEVQELVLQRTHTGALSTSRLLKLTEQHKQGMGSSWVLWYRHNTLHSGYISLLKHVLTSQILVRKKPLIACFARAFQAKDVPFESSLNFLLLMCSSMHKPLQSGLAYTPAQNHSCQCNYISQTCPPPISLETATTRKSRENTRQRFQQQHFKRHLQQCICGPPRAGSSWPGGWRTARRTGCCAGWPWTAARPPWHSSGTGGSCPWGWGSACSEQTARSGEKRSV